MSSELERRLREGRETLPEPDTRATERARQRAVAAIRRRRPRARIATLVAVAFVAVLGAGVGLGSLIAPSSTAAPGPIGTGFLPGPGWTVLQSGEDATPERQALAVASNVPLHPEDDARGIRGSSGLPYSTLLELPERGVVIVALFTRRESEFWNDEFYPARELPLRVADLVSSPFSYQLRPARPLGQYELWATVGDHHVNLHLYFGTRNPSSQLTAAAQRQLGRLVIASVTAGEDASRPALVQSAVSQTASRIIDRTVICPVSPGNPREIAVSATSGTRLFGDKSRWARRPSIWFHDARSQTTTAPLVHAGIVAGWPPDSEPGRPPNPDSLSYSPRCRSTTARIPLSAAGLSGGVASPVEDRYDCVVPSRVLVRLRAVFRGSTSIRRKKTRLIDQFVARGAVKEATLVVGTSSGARIAFGSAHESGQAKLLVGSSCGPSG